MTDSSRALGAPTWLVRTGLGVLGAVQVANGVWATAAPRSFYGEFPFGRGWVEALPAYNEHLMRDVGALFLATGFVVLAAAWFANRRLVAVALVSYLLFSVPHAIYHLGHLDPYATGDALANGVALAATVVVPAGFLVALGLASAHGSSGATAPRSSAARIASVPEDTRRLLPRLTYRLSRRRFGAVIDPLRLYAHHPIVMSGYGAHELAAERARRVPGRLKHLAALRAGMVAGCEWCCDFGSALSAAEDVSEDDMRALSTYERSGRFTELERLALDLATGMSRTPVDVPDALFARLRNHLDEAELVELTDAIALENYRARFNWAFGLAGQGFSDGTYCVRPLATAADESSKGRVRA